MRARSSAAREPRYLVAATYLNMNNQRQTLLRSLLTAQQLGFTLVLPHWQLDYEEYPPAGVALLAPFDYFYSSEALAQHAGQWLGVKVVTELPPHLVPACLSQLQHTWSSEKSLRQLENGTNEIILYNGVCPSVHNITEAILQWGDGHHVACLSARCIFNIQSHGEFHRLNAFRPGLQLSQVFLNEVEAVLSAVEARFGTRRYITVHARTEADWQRDCPLAERTWAFGFACYATPEEIALFLQPRFAEGTVVYVASGDPLSTFPLLCQYFRCWNRELVRPQLGPGIVDKVTARVFLSLQLATRGYEFVGNRFSSFTAEVYTVFESRNTRYWDTDLVTMYNPPKPAEMRAPPFETIPTPETQFRTDED